MANVNGTEIDLMPTEGMRTEAERYRAWKADGRPGGTDVAATRAGQILSGDELSPDTVITMAAWFARHEVDKAGEGFSPGEDSYPSPGRVAWAAWGGDPGQTWSNSKGAAIENAREDRAAVSSLSTGNAAPMEQRDHNSVSLYRNAVVASWCRAEDDPDVIEFSFSSEEPVERYFGMEVLSHEPGAMNMARLNSGAAPWLWNHNPDVVLGGVEKAWQGGDGRGMVRTRWSPNTKAEGSDEWKVRQNWEAGIIRNVSFMYSIDAPLDLKSRDGVALVTAFTPMEVSTVSIPADPTVGQGRAIGDTAAPAATPSTPKPPVEDNINVGEVQAAAITAERTRVASITALCREHKADDLAQGLIESGASEADAMRQILNGLAKRAAQPATPRTAAAQPIASGSSADIGLTDKEARSFSFLKCMRAQLFPNERAFQEEAAFEREVSNATAQRMGLKPKGMLIANDVLSRSLTAGTAATAGDLIFTDARPGSFIELLRKRNFLTGLGVTILSGLTGPVGIPKQTGASQVYWKGEGVAAAESEPSVGQVTMTLKEMSAWTRFSRSLMLQSSIDVETFVRNDLVTVMALEQARVALYGLGSSSQPEGIKLTTGINTKDFGANQPTYAELVDMETLIAADDADISTMGYVTNATIYGGFKTTEKAANTAQFVLEPGGTVNSYGVVRSNQVESGDVFFGVWSQLVLGLFGAVDLQVNPYSEDKEGNIRVVAHQAIDYAVRHPQAFCRGNNTL
ncbi:MAG: phage major capsid protein [Cyanobacteriota bacterium]|jgi:HK97 family phage major capsid protein